MGRTERGLQDLVSLQQRRLGLLQSLEVAQADLSRVDELLNEMGQERWDCYHVGESGQGRVFYFKRNKTNAAAYLTNLFRLGAVAF